MRRDGRHQRSRLCVAKVRTCCVEGRGRALQSTASAAAGFFAGRNRGAPCRRHKGGFQTDRLFFAGRSLRAARSNPAGGTRRLSCRTRQALRLGRENFPTYLILVSLNSTCLRTTGSYFLNASFSVLVRAFFLVT